MVGHISDLHQKAKEKKELLNHLSSVITHWVLQNEIITKMLW